MSIESVSRVLQISLGKPAMKLVLIGIANHDGDGGAWPSVKTLARYACISERQVQRYVAEMADMGLVRVEDQAGGVAQTRNDRRPNRYVINWDRVTSMSPRDERGDTQGRNGVTPRVERGDIAMSPEPSLTVHEPSNNTSHQPPVDVMFEKNFDSFWAMYPRRVGKGAARVALKKALTRECAAEIATALAARVKDWERSRTPMDKIPHPATWLNQERWTDEIPGYKPLRLVAPEIVTWSPQPLINEIAGWAQSNAKIRAEFERHTASEMRSIFTGQHDLGFADEAIVSAFKQLLHEGIS